MSEFKAALIERAVNGKSQVIKIPKLKVFHVKEKVKTPAWVGLDGLQAIRELTVFTDKIFANSSHRVHDLYIFSINAHETFLRLNGVTGLKYLFSLNESKTEKIVGHIKAKNFLSQLEYVKERESTVCDTLKESTVLKSVNIKKFTTLKNNADKSRVEVEKLISTQYAELAKLLNNGWR
jgi:hypothetical protein